MDIEPNEKKDHALKGVLKTILLFLESLQLRSTCNILQAECAQMGYPELHRSQPHTLMLRPSDTYSSMTSNSKKRNSSHGSSGKGGSGARSSLSYLHKVAPGDLSQRQRVMDLNSGQVEDLPVMVGGGSRGSAGDMQFLHRKMDNKDKGRDRNDSDGKLNMSNSANMDEMNVRDLLSRTESAMKKLRLRGVHGGDSGNLDRHSVSVFYADSNEGLSKSAYHHLHNPPHLANDYQQQYHHPTHYDNAADNRYLTYTLQSLCSCSSCRDYAATMSSSSAVPPPNDHNLMKTLSADTTDGATTGSGVTSMGNSQNHYCGILKNPRGNVPGGYPPPACRNTYPPDCIRSMPATQLSDEHLKLLAIASNLTHALQTQVRGQSDRIDELLAACRRICPDFFVPCNPTCIYQSPAPPCHLPPTCACVPTVCMCSVEDQEAAAQDSQQEHNPDLEPESVLDLDAELEPEFVPELGLELEPELESEPVPEETKTGDIVSGDGSSSLNGDEAPPVKAVKQHRSRCIAKALEVRNQHRLISESSFNSLYCYGTELDFKKIKRHLLTKTSTTKLLLLQALRWRLTKSDDDSRDHTLNSYIRNDLLGLNAKDPTAFLTNILGDTSSEDAEVMHETTARLVNAFASLILGRDYLSFDDKVATELLIPLLTGLHPNGGIINQKTRDFLIATLQKLSLRAKMRKLMISNGLVEYLSDYLSEHLNTMNSYCIEYSTALLMNLCLQTEAQVICTSRATQVVQLVKNLLKSPYQCCLLYVNGIMYSLLRNSDINQEAIRAKLTDDLNAAILQYRDDNELRRQFEVVLALHNNNIDPDLEVACANAEPDEELDIIEPELDMDDSVDGTDDILFKYRIKLDESPNATVTANRLSALCNPTTPRSARSANRSKSVDSGPSANTVMSAKTVPLGQNNNAILVKVEEHTSNQRNTSSERMLETKSDNRPRSITSENSHSNQMRSDQLVNNSTGSPGTHKRNSANSYDIKIDCIPESPEDFAEPVHSTETPQGSSKEKQNGSFQESIIKSGGSPGPKSPSPRGSGRSPQLSQDSSRTSKNSPQEPRDYSVPHEPNIDYPTNHQLLKDSSSSKKNVADGGSNQQIEHQVSNSTTIYPTSRTQPQIQTSTSGSGRSPQHTQDNSMSCELNVNDLQNASISKESNASKRPSASSGQQLQPQVSNSKAMEAASGTQPQIQTSPRGSGRSPQLSRDSSKTSKTSPQQIQDYLVQYNENIDDPKNRRLSKELSTSKQFSAGSCQQNQRQGSKSICGPCETQPTIQDSPRGSARSPKLSPDSSKTSKTSPQVIQHYSVPYYQNKDVPNNPQLSKESSTSKRSSTAAVSQNVQPQGSQSKTIETTSGPLPQIETSPRPQLTRDSSKTSKISPQQPQDYNIPYEQHVDDPNNTRMSKESSTTETRKAQPRAGSGHQSQLPVSKSNSLETSLGTRPKSQNSDMTTNSAGKTTPSLKTTNTSPEETTGKSQATMDTVSNTSTSKIMDTASSKWEKDYVPDAENIVARDAQKSISSKEGGQSQRVGKVTPDAQNLVGKPPGSNVKAAQRSSDFGEKTHTRTVSAPARMVKPPNLQAISEKGGDCVLIAVASGMIIQRISGQLKTPESDPVYIELGRATKEQLSRVRATLQRGQTLEEALLSADIRSIQSHVDSEDSTISMCCGKELMIGEDICNPDCIAIKEQMLAGIELTGCKDGKVVIKPKVAVKKMAVPPKRKQVFQDSSKTKHGGRLTYGVDYPDPIADCHLAQLTNCERLCEVARKRFCTRANNQCQLAVRPAWCCSTRPPQSIECKIPSVTRPAPSPLSGYYHPEARDLAYATRCANEALRNYTCECSQDTRNFLTCRNSCVFASNQNRYRDGLYGLKRCYRDTSQ